VHLAALPSPTAPGKSPRAEPGEQRGFPRRGLLPAPPAKRPSAREVDTSDIINSAAEPRRHPQPLPPPRSPVWRSDSDFCFQEAGGSGHVPSPPRHPRARRRLRSTNPTSSAQEADALQTRLLSDQRSKKNT